MEALLLKDTVSEDLALRNMAASVFEAKEFKGSGQVLVDFAGIKSISRSFAHEYMKRKNEQSCEVVDINVPPNIKRMFEVVENTHIKPELLKAKVPTDLA